MVAKSENIVSEEPRIVLVAGCSSGVGKTSVAEAVLRLLSSRYRTAAVKITVTHGERGCPHGGKGCNVCSSLGGDFQIISNDSVISQPGTDTSRCKLAGGKPVLWIITRDVAISAAWQETRAFLNDVDCVVVESNTLADCTDPLLTLMVIDPSISRKIWKPSAEHLIAKANWVVFNRRGSPEQRDALTNEVRRLRDGLKEVIDVSHPHEVTSHPILAESLLSLCGAIRRR